MDLQALEALEERVNKAVAVIAGLKDDKKKLESENGALRQQLDGMAKQQQSAETASAELEGLRAENRRLTGLQAEIRRRLEGVIAKLERYKD
jgi:hypothetical protein